MIIPTPMPVAHAALPFDDPHWIYEIKHDGWRALMVLDRGEGIVLSRNRQRLPGFRSLARMSAREIRASYAILDGELTVTDAGRAKAASRTTRTSGERYYAFDLLWLDGQDLRALPLVERKQALRDILPRRAAHLIYVDHVAESGIALYERACRMDLEGIVAKQADSGYSRDALMPAWIAIDNPAYKQNDGRWAWPRTIPA